MKLKCIRDQIGFTKGNLYEVMETHNSLYSTCYLVFDDDFYERFVYVDNGFFVLEFDV